MQDNNKKAADAILLGRATWLDEVINSPITADDIKVIDKLMENLDDYKYLFSSRNILNSLKRAGIDSVFNLVKHSRKDIRKICGIDKNNISEIDHLVEDVLRLSYEMNIKHYIVKQLMLLESSTVY